MKGEDMYKQKRGRQSILGALLVCALILVIKWALVPGTEAGKPSENVLEPERTHSEIETVSESSSAPLDSAESDSDAALENDTVLDEGGTYTSKASVSAYLNRYGHLPPNYITKAEARALGWDGAQGNLWEVAEGKSIGGDVFGNREGRLPKAKGRKWFECDIDYEGGYRGAKRIVFSDDGLIYYTDDHYETFERLEADG